jgi:4-amino-4-deoxy-L-arabinose transferase-like glycosyltransferase
MSASGRTVAGPAIVSSNDSRRPAARLFLVSAAVFILSLIVLGWRIHATPIGSTFADPLAQIRAQDESMYVNSAFRMTQDGDWLNPKLMGRLFLFKPPLLQWFTASCIHLFGLGLLSVRLPSLAAGAAGVAIVFAWVALRRSQVVAGIAALLLVSDPIWATFSRLCFTDVVASVLALAAMFQLALDPALDRRRSRILFGAFAGAAVLAKSVVGVLPFVALAAYWFPMPRSARPRLGRLAECAAVAFAVAAPWHLYQIAVHPRWFWIEFVKYQLLAVGVSEATGVTGYPLFYPRRLLAMDPALLVFAAAGVFGAVRALRKRDAVSMAGVGWALAVALALVMFRGRSLSYLVLLLPGLCLVAGLFLPRRLERWGPALIAILVAGFAVRAGVSGHPWSLRYSSPPVESAAGLRDYYLQNRDTELFIAAADDAFYAITLPGLPVRYCFVDAARTIEGFAPHYLELGIALTPDQLARLPDSTAEYVRRMSEWGVQSAEAVGTAVLLQSPAEITEVVRTRPGADFNVPASWEPLPDVADTHETRRVGGRVFLLARGARTRVEPRSLPAGW